MRNQFAAINDDDHTGSINWAIRRVTFESVEYCSFRYISLSNGYIRDCILARGDQWVIRHHDTNKSQDEPTHFDMTNNWWGTANPDSIQAWINDGLDDPAIGTIIDWYPFKAEPLATEKKSLGDLKAMFR